MIYYTLTNITVRPGVLVLGKRNRSIWKIQQRNKVKNQNCIKKENLQYLKCFLWHLRVLCGYRMGPPEMNWPLTRPLVGFSDAAQVEPERCFGDTVLLVTSATCVCVSGTINCAIRVMFFLWWVKPLSSSTVPSAQQKDCYRRPLMQ